MRERIASLMFLLCVCLSVSAKDRSPLVAVVLYQVNSGTAYVELADFAVNGRREMYVCKGPSLTGGDYKHLEKTIIEPGMVLERAQSGALTLTAKSNSKCVLPANLKLDKSRSYSAAELADMAAITGTLAGRSSNAGDAVPANIQAEMQLHLVAEADTELAEYLRAEHANTIELWSNFLLQYQASSRAGEGRKALAKLITDEGDRHFAEYRKSLEAGKPRFDELRKAREAAQKALEVQKGFLAAERLRLNTDSELYRIVGLARSEFNSYLRAISEHTGGYAHLTQALSHLQEAYLVDPSYTATEQLKIAVYTQAQEFETAVKNAESLLAEKKFDGAYTSVVRYRSFAGEVQRVAAVVNAAFEYHRNLGRQFTTEANWERSIREFQRALECKEDAETAASLQNAQTELKTLRDKEAALATAAEARALIAKKQYIRSLRNAGQFVGVAAPAGG
jgi:tetratricopeptide (TPR) repeat protein